MFGLAQFFPYVFHLHQKPQVRLKANSTVFIRNGTRQRCPLLPLLFILSLEPFIRKVNHNPDIKGFNINSKAYKTTAYVDDLLFFLTGPHISILNLVKEFQYYGYVSSMRINLKSEDLNITLSPNSLTLVQSNCSFKWETTDLKYFGIRLIPTVADIKLILNHY